MFEYLSGICGSSKTELLINHVIDRMRFGEHFLYAVPFTDLCDEIAGRFKLKGISPKVIHSKNAHENCSVGERIIEEMGRIDPDAAHGQVFIVTQEAMRSIPYFPNNTPESFWTVIHDEAVDPTSYIELRFKEHQQYIDGVITIPRKSWHLDFVPAVPKGNLNLSQQRAIIRNTHGDEVWEKLSDFYQHIQNAHEGKCDLFVHMSEYKSFKEGDGNKFIATAVYNPVMFKKFRRVIFAGALFEYELMFNLWRDFFGVTWKESPLKSQLTTSTHSNPLKVVYVFDNLAWSRYRAGQAFEGKQIKEHIDEIARDYFASSKHPVVFVSNKGERKPQDDWIDCPYGNKGSNKFREYRNLAYTGAFNHATPYYNFMKWAGCENIVKISQNVSHLYQTVMRLKIRNYDCQDECTLFVPCKSMIDPIAGYFTSLKFERFESPFTNRLRESVVDQRAADPNQRDYLKAPGDTRSDNLIRVKRHEILKRLKRSTTRRFLL